MGRNERVKISMPGHVWDILFFFFFAALQVRAERVGVEGEGKEGWDERREGVVPTGPRRRLRPGGLLSLPVRRGVWGGGFILVRLPQVCGFIYLSSSFYYNKRRKDVFHLLLNFTISSLWSDLLSRLSSYEVQLESRVRRKGLGKFLIQILQLIANR